MTVAADRRQLEHLRIGLALEFHDQAHDTRLVTSGAQQLDVRIVGRNLARQSVEDTVELDSLEIDHQALGILDQEVGVLQWRRMLDRHPRVVGSRPDAHRKNRGAATGCRLRQRADRQQQ
ncbi:MAG: hypothetical protein AW07_03063 [Candidatus Accumulibacter sp. SK-11]|nr:MAG: hypothetical protein AW07_03063 [Candidatus Accumulibacter sp. SK-11]